LFRIVGFPAIIEHHLTMGVGYKFTSRMHVNLSYMHGFEATISETSENDLATLESTLVEDSVSLGFTALF
jgi:long-chain fatty acid transport protein